MPSWGSIPRRRCASAKNADMGSLNELFDAATVARLAGPLVYQRGAGYLLDRRVESVEAGGGRLTATVRGTMPYFVELRADRGRPRWSCTCPAAEDGSFCKHCVATALSLTLGDEPPVLAAVVARGRSGDPTFHDGSGSDAEEELADSVRGLAPERLAEIVLDRAQSDWRLRERLLAEAQAGRGVGPDLAGWRRRIDMAFADRDFMSHGFVTYQEAAGWAAAVGDVIDSLEDLCDAGHHDATARLCEHAHRCADKAVEYVDDSDGWLSGISSRLSELHLRACEAGRPDPVELAGRLLELELASELDGFHRSAASYAGVLGETGLAAFRGGLEPRLEGISAEADRWSGGAFAVEQALVGWALGTGDPDALIEAHSRRSVLAGDVLEIAQALDRAGRGEEAVAWARRGLAEQGSRPWQVGGLRDFLARKLRDRGEEKAAVLLFWEAFVSSPSLSAYRRLLDEGAGEEWLARCRDELRGSLARVAGGTGPGAGRLATPAAAFAPLPPAVPGAAVALLDILLFEGLVDDAWDVANDYGCRAQTWLTLARARQESHPLDAIAVYESAALAIIDRKKADQYQSAVDLMVQVRRLADSAAKPGRFMSLLERVRTEHKAKRKLKALLDAQGW